MKGSLFNKPLEWSIETVGESWQQGSTITGILKVKNHGSEVVSLKNSGVALAHGEMKKIHSRVEGALQIELREEFKEEEAMPGKEVELSFSLKLPENSPVSDKKSSYYLTYGREFNESHLQLKIEPYILFTKVIGLMDTFHRFKLKELKSSKKGVEYKLLPPTARDMANIESLLLTPSMQGDVLEINFAFQVKKLDTASVTTKVTKETLKVKRELTAKEYSLGKDMINQDQLLKSIESVLSEIKLKSVF